MLESEGVDPDSVESAVVGTSGPLIAKTFEDGEIQAYVGNASDFTALSANNVALRKITPDEAAAIDGNPMAVLPGTLDEKRDAIVGFLRAWTKAQHVGQVDSEGPVSPGLLARLQRSAGEFDFVVLFSVRYHQAYYGARALPDRAVLVPT